MKKLFCFACLCVFALAFGGTAYLFFDGRALFGVVNIALMAFAYPYVKARYDELTND